MTPGKKRARFLSLFFFYFLVTLLFPYSHCYASEGVAERDLCWAGHGADHLLLFPEEACCELHERGHADDHHIHFLVGDQAAIVIKAGASHEAGADRFSAAVEQFLPADPPAFSSLVQQERSISGLKGFFSAFSGLSPPVA